jgi:hypothetical protein
VFLPDKHAAGYGEHCTDPDSKAAEKKCYCDALYGSQKHWGCGWFKIWTENVRQAVKLNHKLQVYFLCGVVGEGTVKWDHLREHDRLCDAILDGVTAKERNHILSTELFPFDGLGQSQKGEVAWLEKNGYDFEMLDIGPFLLGARIMSVGNILPPSKGSGGTSGHQCVVSMPMSAYFHINEQIVQPLVEEGALSFAGVFAPPQTPYHGEHWMFSDTECYCKQLQDPFGCLYFAKWINNVERAKANGHELLVCYGHGLRGKGKTASWGECEETTRQYDRFSSVGRGFSQTSRDQSKCVWRSSRTSSGMSSAARSVAPKGVTRSNGSLLSRIAVCGGAGAVGIILRAGARAES